MASSAESLSTAFWVVVVDHKAISLFPTLGETVTELRRLYDDTRPQPILLPISNSTYAYTPPGGMAPEAFVRVSSGVRRADPVLAQGVLALLRQRWLRAAELTRGEAQRRHFLNLIATVERRLALLAVN